MSGGAAGEAPAPIPVTVVGGYLGAGKTTLVNQLLRQANGLRLAVLVNDFGALPIDADLIEAQDGNVVAIAGGCVCCSYGSDLVAALMDLAKLAPRPAHVLIEASGVALPGQVASALSLLSTYALDCVVTLVDAGAVRTHAADPYLADTITRQLADADLVVLNKCDVVDAQARSDLALWVQAQAPQARFIEARHGAVPLSVMLGRQMTAQARRAEPAIRMHGWDHHGHVHDATEYVAKALAVTHVARAAALATALQDPALGLLRAKGIVVEPDGRAYVVQLAGGRTHVTPARSGQTPRGLVAIGRAGQTDLENAERRLQLI